MGTVISLSDQPVEWVRHQKPIRVMTLLPGQMPQQRAANTLSRAQA
jgi:hypothetical protein